MVSVASEEGACILIGHDPARDLPVNLSTFLSALSISDSSVHARKENACHQPFEILGLYHSVISFIAPHCLVGLPFAVFIIRCCLA